MEKEYPKVLVIAHNPFSDIQNNGKTLSAFFEGWPKDRIAQLYLTPDEPSFTVCENFYRVMDIEVLKQLLKKKEAGSKVNKSNIVKNEKEILHKNKIYRLIRNLALKRLPIIDFFRNMVWRKIRPWNNQGVEEWLEEFKPEIIFFQSSNSYAVFDMVNEICNKYNTKLFMETTDDYVTKHFSVDPFYLFNINKLIRRYQMLVNKTECVFAIGEMMANEYKKRFGGKYEVAMNSIDLKDNIVPYSKINNKTIRLIYAGNLGLNRWKILSKIGIAIKELKKEKKINAFLEIYSINKPSKKILDKLNIEGSSEYKGSLSSEKLIKVRNNSDILVHVEAFDRKNKRITRLSVSTKIPEYLLSERCILAVGPEDVASIKYIKDNKIGKVITDIKIEKLKNELLCIIENKELRKTYIKNGKEIALRNHSYYNNKNKVQNKMIKS